MKLVLQILYPDVIPEIILYNLYLWLQLAFVCFLDDIISLEDLNKNCQENEDAPETLPETELLQGLVEENITSYAGSGCLDTVLPQS